MSELIKVGDEIQTVIKCVNCEKVLSDPLEVYGAPHLEQCSACFLAGLDPSDLTEGELEKELRSIEDDIDEVKDRIEDLERDLEDLEDDQKKLKKKIADRKVKDQPNA